jgi:protein-S-isoprenylcysteine O-methyltransferase Ste14
MMSLIINLASALLILLGAYIVFRIFVRRDYQQKGRLSFGSSMLELLVFCVVFCYPFVYNSSGWGWFWSESAPAGTTAWITGMLILAAGFGLAFGTMFWFGIRRAFGLQANKLVQNGLYRFSRNPQVLGGYLLVIGSSIIWQSWYNLVWIGLYAATTHWMIITEEEHLRQSYGAEYASYCQNVPRYLSFRHITQPQENRN